MLKNMRIGKKLIITFLLVAIISSIGGIVGLIVMRNMNSSYNMALENYGFAQGDVGRYSTELNNIRVIMRNAVIETDPQKIQESSDDLTKSYAKMDTYFADLKKTVVTDKELKYYNDIKNNREQFRAVTDQVMELAKENKNKEAYALLVEQATPISNTMRISVEGLLNEKTTLGDQIDKTLTSQANTAIYVILIVVLASLGISSVIAILIARSISKPVGEMAEVAKKMAEGNLGEQIHVDSKNEIGQLADALTQSNASIRAYIAEKTKNLGKNSKRRFNGNDY